MTDPTTAAERDRLIVAMAGILRNFAPDIGSTDRATLAGMLADAAIEAEAASPLRAALDDVWQHCACQPCEQRRATTAPAPASAERDAPSLHDRLRRALYRYDGLVKHDQAGWIDADLCYQCDSVATTLLINAEKMDGPMSFDADRVLDALRAAEART